MSSPEDAYGTTGMRQAADGNHTVGGVCGHCSEAGHSTAQCPNKVPGAFVWGVDEAALAVVEYLRGKGVDL